ncbi:MAG: NAD(P)H-dependent oxidoreductase [Clostridia bacterium]|nr:NAD(P)H-dependent oxidoreductase [Clostridia bacterium]
MKITVIHGQNHKGSTWHAAEELLKNIDTEHECREFYLPRDLDHFCSGCLACLKSRDRCPFWPEKEPIDRALRESDLLIFTTPTYCMLPSAPLKAFMDLFFTNWMSHKPYAEMFSKRAVVISTAAGAGAKRATGPVAEMLLYWGVPKIWRYGLAVNACSWESMPEKKKAVIIKDMKKLGKKLSVGKIPHVGIKTRALFRLMKGMQKADWGASPDEKQYWQENGWLDGKKPWVQ